MSKFITHLALDEFQAASVEATKAAICNTFPDVAVSSGNTDGSEDVPAYAFILRVDDLPVAIMFNDQPLPKDAWLPAAKQTLVMKDAEAIMRKTKAHVVIALLEDTRTHSAALAGATAVTLAAGVLAKMLSAAAAVFTESNTIVPGADLTSSATRLVRDSEIPEVLWSSIQFMRGPELPDGRPQVAALTTGMFPFIGREIEFAPSPLAPGAIAERLIGLCQYLISKGPVIKDGETVGLSETEKIDVRWVDQSQRPGLPVMVLAFNAENT